MTWNYLKRIVPMFIHVRITSTLLLLPVTWS